MTAITTPIRKPELWVREGRVWKSSSVEGNGLVLLAGFSTSVFSALAGGLCVVCSIRLLIAFQISFDALFRVADGVRQFDLRKIVGIKTLNITLVSAGHGFLRLHDFQVVGHSGGEAILRLRERLFRQVDGTAGHFDLLGGGVQIEQRGADLIVDAAAEISQLRTRLLQLGVGLEHVAVNAIAGEDRDVDASIDLPGAVRLAGGDADVAEIGVQRRPWDNARAAAALRDSSAARTWAKAA